MANSAPLHNRKTKQKADDHVQKEVNESHKAVFTNVHWSPHSHQQLKPHSDDGKGRQLEEKKPFGGIIKIKINRKLQRREGVSSCFPLKPFFVAGQLFSVWCFLARVESDCWTAPVPSWSKIEVERQKPKEGWGGELPHSSTEGLWSRDSQRLGEEWWTPTLQPLQSEHTAVWHRPVWRCCASGWGST